MPDSDKCLAYATHLRREHRRLHKAVQTVQQLFSKGRDTSQWPDQGVAADVSQQLHFQLNQMRGDLAHHFREEEEGGCIEEAISRCPSFSELANELEDQHSVLLKTLDQLIEHTKVRDCDASSWDKADREFHEFAGNLRAHELQESRIIQQAFGCGLEIDDGRESDFTAMKRHD